MEEKFAAVVYKAEDKGENDRRLYLITPLGTRQAVMRGVKKSTAKLRFAAMPFSFCEFVAAEKNGFLIITSAHQIEDLFDIAQSQEKLTAGSLILESAFCALKSDCAPAFIFMLHRLKEVLCAEPFAAAVRFLQYLIHDAGYGYDYQKFDAQPQTPLQLLSVLHFLDSNQNAQPQNPSLVKKTLIKLIDNFETKFEITLKAKKFL